MNLDILSGPSLDDLQAQPCLPPGDLRLVDYWAQVGETLAADPRSKSSPELTALAFWLRRARLEKWAAPLRAEHERTPTVREGTPPSAYPLPDGRGSLRLARGTVLHIAPANVEAMFAYSLCLASLCGNRSIVRLPSRRGVIAQAIIEALARPPLARMHTLATYARDNAVTTQLSALCDTRIIWGGDATVREIGALPLPPRANEIRFADRFSMALLNAAQLPSGDALGKLAAALLADITAFDQLACSCPRLLVWVGAEAQVEAAQAAFWPAVASACDARRLPLEPSRAVDRRMAACRMAAAGASAITDLADGRLTRVTVPSASLMPALADLHPGGGLLLEGRSGTVEETAAWLPPHGQTVAAAGFTREENLRFAQAASGRVSRIVAPGHALDFGPVWDGRDLFAELTRTVVIS